MIKFFFSSSSTLALKLQLASATIVYLNREGLIQKETSTISTPAVQDPSLLILTWSPVEIIQSNTHRWYGTKIKNSANTIRKKVLSFKKTEHVVGVMNETQVVKQNRISVKNYPESRWPENASTKK